MSRDAKVHQRADDGFFNAEHILFDVIACALEVDQRVGHDLARAVKGNLSPTVRCHYSNATRRQEVICLPGQSLCEYGRVLANPNLIGVSAVRDAVKSCIA